MSSETDEPVPSVSPGSSQSSAPSTVQTTPELMNVSPLVGNSGEPVVNSVTLPVKEALKKRDWLDNQLHQLKVQLYMKKSDHCKAIDSIPEDELNKMHQKLKDELINKTAVQDSQEQILRGEHLVKTARDILNSDLNGSGDKTTVARKRELENLLNEFTTVSSDVARKHKDIVKLRDELTDVKKRNFEQLKRCRQLYQEIDHKKKLREEELESLSTDPVGQRLHEELKAKLQENSILCNILQGLILGSGINWAQDDSVQTLLLETAQPDQL